MQWLQNDHEKILVRGGHEHALDILYRESVVYPKTNFPLADLSWLSHCGESKIVNVRLEVQGTKTHKVVSEGDVDLLPMKEGAEDGGGCFFLSHLIRQDCQA